MEKFVNEIIERLDSRFSCDDLSRIKESILAVAIDYDITLKSTEIAPVFNGIPEEVKHYLVSKKIEGKSQKTLQQYLYALQRFFRYVPKPVYLIKSEDVRLFLYNLMQDTQMSGVSIENQRIIICSFFKWLALNGYLEKDPCAPIKKIKCEKKIREPLSDTEMEKMRIACKNDMEKAIVEVLYSTGCRVSELVNISIDDINFENREVRLFGKGKKQRVAYLNARAILNIRLLLGNRKYNTVDVFTSSKAPHEKLSTRRVEIIIKEIGERAEIAGRVFPHRIRHTTATDALRRGMAIEQVQQLLGHEKIATTLEYAKISREDVKNKHSKYII